MTVAKSATATLSGGLSAGRQGGRCETLPGKTSLFPGECICEVPVLPNATFESHRHRMVP